jgi:hypothetical protein
LRKAPAKEEFTNPKELETTVVFTKREETLRKGNINPYCEDGETQRIVLVNENNVTQIIVIDLKVMNSNPRPINVNVVTERPTTSVQGAH